MRHGCTGGLGTTSIPLSLSLTLILLGRISNYLLLLLCSTKPTRALSIVHPPTLRVALIHGTYRGSRISWLRLLLLLVVVVNARRGRGRPLMMTRLARWYRGRSHATRAAASTDKAAHYPRRLWGGGGGRGRKTVSRCLRLRRNMWVQVFFSGQVASSPSLRDTFCASGGPGGRDRYRLKWIGGER